MAERDPKELQESECREVSVPDAEQAAASLRKRRRWKILAALAAGQLLIGGAAYAFIDRDHVSTDNA